MFNMYLIFYPWQFFLRQKLIFNCCYFIVVIKSKIKISKFQINFFFFQETLHSEFFVQKFRSRQITHSNGSSLFWSILKWIFFFYRILRGKKWQLPVCYWMSRKFCIKYEGVQVHHKWGCHQDVMSLARTVNMHKNLQDQVCTQEFDRRVTQTLCEDLQTPELPPVNIATSEKH